MPSLSSVGERVCHLPEAPGSRRRNPHNGGVVLPWAWPFLTPPPAPQQGRQGGVMPGEGGMNALSWAGVGRPGKDHDNAQPAVLICTVGVMLLPLGVLGAPGSGGPQQALVSAGGVVLGRGRGQSEPGQGHCTDTCNSHNSSSKNHTGLNIRQGFPKLSFSSEGMPLPVGVTGLV